MANQQGHPVSAESYTHCFRNVHFHLLSFGSAGSSLRRGLFTACAERGCSLLAALGLLTAVASPNAEQGLRGSSARAQITGSAVVAPRHADLPGSEIGARTRRRILYC